MPIQQAIERIEDLLKDCSERSQYLPKEGLALALEILKEEKFYKETKASDAPILPGDMFIGTENGMEIVDPEPKEKEKK